MVLYNYIKQFIYCTLVKRLRIQAGPDTEKYGVRLLVNMQIYTVWYVSVFHNYGFVVIVTNYAM